LTAQNGYFAWGDVAICLSTAPRRFSALPGLFTAIFAANSALQHRRDGRGRCKYPGHSPLLRQADEVCHQCCHCELDVEYQKTIRNRSSLIRDFQLMAKSASDLVQCVIGALAAFPPKKKMPVR